METDQLAELIDQKHRVLKQLLDLANRQTQLIEQSDMTAMMSLLSARQSLLAEIQKIERSLDPFRGQDPDSRQWRSAEHRQRTRDAAAECDRLLEEIMSIDKHSESSLIHRRDQAADQLQGIHTATQARSAYTQTPVQSSNLDLSSES